MCALGSISVIQLPYDSGRFGKRMGRGPIALMESELQRLTVPLLRDALSRQARPIILSAFPRNRAVAIN